MQGEGGGRYGVLLMEVVGFHVYGFMEMNVAKLGITGAVVQIAVLLKASWVLA